LEYDTTVPAPIVEPEPVPGDGRVPQKWKVLITVIFGIFMVILDSTVVNVAFQTLRREFGADINQAQWVISVYVLALGISTPLAGFMADRFGIKRVYILGLATFVGGSMLCASAGSLEQLIAARALQGFGGGLAIPLGAALLLTAFPREEQGMALGTLGIALVLAPALGPILGGYLADEGAWRAIFWINVPIGLTGVLLASRFLRERRSDRRPSLDLLGLVTEVIGFGAMLYAAALAASHAWDSPEVVTAFTIGAVGLAAFVVVELWVAKDPLLNLRLFKDRTFAIATLVGYVSVVALFGAEFLMPLYLQSLRGFSAFQTGVLLLPLGIMAGICLPLAGRLYDRIGPRPLLVTGFSVLALNTWQLSQIQADTPISWIVLLLALRGIALGLTVQTTYVTALGVVPVPEIARGSSLVNATRQLMQAVAVALLATILASTISPTTRATQARLHGVPESHAAEPIALCSPDVPPAAAADLLAEMRLACAESVQGFERAYTLTFLGALVALGLGALLPGWPGPWSGRKVGGEPPPGPLPEL
jgi:EmrB/QacA subfamily drug resistance transporter